MEVRDPSIGSPVHVGPGEGRAVRMPGMQILTRKVSSERTGGAYSLFEVTVAPGGGEGHHIQHREDECFYVLKGRFEFVVENARIAAGPGSLVYVPKGNLHAFENAGETTGRMLVSQTPGGAYGGFVEEVGEPANGEGGLPSPKGTPDNAQRLAAVGAEYGVETVTLLP